MSSIDNLGKVKQSIDKTEGLGVEYSIPTYSYASAHGVKIPCRGFDVSDRFLSGCNKRTESYNSLFKLIEESQSNNEVFMAIQAIRVASKAPKVSYTNLDIVKQDSYALVDVSFNIWTDDNLNLDELRVTDIGDIYIVLMGSVGRRVIGSDSPVCELQSTLLVPLWTNTIDLGTVIKDISSGVILDSLVNDELSERSMLLDGSKYDWLPGWIDGD